MTVKNFKHSLFTQIILHPNYSQTSIQTMGKKGLKKKKKKKAKKTTSSLLGDLGGIEVEVAEKVDKFVNCQLKLINWIFLDFELKDCNVEKMRLFTIKRKIKERHGRIKDLKVYMGTVSPSTELTDDMATLSDMGVEGSEKNEIDEPDEIVLYYDFKPFEHNDPLLLVDPRGASLKK